MATFDKIAELLSSQLGVDKAKITEDTKIVDDLGADSIDVFEMVMALEDECGIQVDEDKVQELVTVGDVVKLIDNNSHTTISYCDFGSCCFNNLL